ncbi:MAG: alpha/beta hydrolase [Deltaproteobacteria bacterium]|nr:alpha/beta hydrolase [Deltaproteobacteria bacterium]
MADVKKILVHGWATDARVWDGVKNSMDGAATLTLPSHESKAAAAWDSPTLAPALAALTKAAGASPAIGIGWSLGAKVLMKAAADGLINLKALILIAPTPSFVKREGFEFAQSRALTRRMRVDMQKDPAATLKRFYRLNFTPEEMETNAAKTFIEKYETSGGFDYNGVTNALTALMETDLKDDAAKINVPTLLIHGSADEVVPLEASVWLHKKIKNSTHVIIEGAGHAPFLTEEETFIGAIKAFLKGI